MISKAIKGKQSHRIKIDNDLMPMVILVLTVIFIITSTNKMHKLLKEKYTY